MKLLVCEECEHRQTIQTYDADDARRLNLRLVPPVCEWCHSLRVKLYDS
ncbi:MAG: hypothetical protein WEE89_00025 [Gemmatimonadota bacterium]